MLRLGLGGISGRRRRRRRGAKDWIHHCVNIFCYVYNALFTIHKNVFSVA